MTYLEAWSLWADGNTIADQQMFGIKILWWGRFGKLLQFTSAMAIVAELIGEANLKQFSNSLYIKEPVGAVSDLFRWPKRSAVPPERDPYHGLNILFVIMIWMLAGLVLTLVAVFSIRHTISTLEFNLFFEIIAGVIMAITILIAMGIILTIFVVVWVSAINLMAYIASLLSSQTFLKFVVLLLIVVGFHFDLLAS